jgi:hypothetical protein
MAVLTPNSFTSWNLTPVEEREGSLLTITQKQCIQNLISSIAEEKIAALFDPNNVQLSMAQDADLTGKINILNHLLDLSDHAESELEIMTNE